MTREEWVRLRGSHWRGWQDRAFDRPDQIPPGLTRAVLMRTKNSHRGIADRSQLRALVAKGADQDFLDEICQLTSLEYLNLAYPVTARDLSCLTRLTELHTVIIDSPRNVTDFSPLMKLPKLHTLLIEHAKHLVDLEFLRDAHHLRVIGVEGSFTTHQKLASLQPLAGLRNLEVLFLAAVRLKDKDITCLAECPKLWALESARFAPKAQFDQLRRLMPDLECRWCDRYEIG